MIPTLLFHILSFAEPSYFPLASHQFNSSPKIISAIFDCTFSVVPSACSLSSPCQKHFLAPRHRELEVRSWVSCARFPWKQLRLSGSGKADTVGCEGTHFTQSFDSSSLWKYSLTSSPASPLLLLPRTPSSQTDQVCREFCASFWYRKLFGIQQNPSATINATNFSDRNLSGLEPVIASIELLPTTKNKQVNHNLLAFLTLFLN